MATRSIAELNAFDFRRGEKGTEGGECSVCSNWCSGIRSWWKAWPGEPGESELYCRACAEQEIGIKKKWIEELRRESPTN